MKFSALAVFAACYASNAYAFAPPQVKAFGLQVRLFCSFFVVLKLRRELPF